MIAMRLPLMNANGGLKKLSADCIGDNRSIELMLCAERNPALYRLNWFIVVVVSSLQRKAFCSLKHRMGVDE